MESVMTGGMDNPVEVVFTPGGERIFTTTFFQHPAGGFRDGLVHAIYGGVYGKVHSVLDGHPRTGDIMPVLTHLGAAAPCGLVRLESDQLGEEYQNNVLACLFNMHKITRHVLVPNGASFDTRDEDFLVSDNLDFHPTDVIEDADGSLLVIDTGGWYKLCCPTSQLHKPDILGAVYRIRRIGSHQIADPRGQKIDWSAATDEELAKLLGDERLAVARRAIELLGRHGADSAKSLGNVLKTSENPQQRLNTIWALTRIDDPTARTAVRSALSDEDETVRQAGLHSSSVRRDNEAEADLISMLNSPSASNRRAAAEALGRIGSSQTVDALLAAVNEKTKEDRALEHSLIYAVIEIGDPQRTRQALMSKDPLIHRAALIALDQMRDGGLQAADVVDVLEADDVSLSETGWWIAENHPEWAGEFVSVVDKILHSGETDPEALTRLSGRLERFASDPQMQSVMGATLTDDTVNTQTQAAVLNAMTFSRLKAIPAVWSEPLEKHLAAADPALLENAVKAVSTLSNGELPASLAKQLRAIVINETLPPQIRLQALAALPGDQRNLDPARLQFLCQHLGPGSRLRPRPQSHEDRQSAPIESSTSHHHEPKKSAFRRMSCASNSPSLVMVSSASRFHCWRIFNKRTNKNTRNWSQFWHGSTREISVAVKRCFTIPRPPASPATPWDIWVAASVRT